MNPEFLREGSAVADFMEPDRIVIGQWDESGGRALAEVYRSFDCPKIFTSLRNAEMIKYASNALLATLVSFSNEFAALCEATPGDRRGRSAERIAPGPAAFPHAPRGTGYAGHS